jgi:hypothetical protein
MPGIKTNLLNLGAAFNTFKGTASASTTTAQKYSNWLECHYLNPEDCQRTFETSELARYQIIFTDGSSRDVVMTRSQRLNMNKTTIWPLVSSVKGLGFQTLK